jgi:hypothetical protein
MLIESALKTPREDASSERRYRCDRRCPPSRKMHASSRPSNKLTKMNKYSSFSLFNGDFPHYALKNPEQFGHRSQSQAFRKRLPSY